jgi:sugar fermentation stimulation protein A
MRFSSPLMRGRLIRRYVRFLADIILDSGETITASCPNTGSMVGLTDPGSVVWVSSSDSPTRKYKHTLEIIEADLGKGPSMVGINTGRPNLLVADAISAGQIRQLRGYAGLRREVRYGENSRIDILLECADKGRCYVEIKTVHMMRRHGLAEFPDCITERGTKHLNELSQMVREGHRAAMVFLIQRSDAARFALARDIDPRYGAAFDDALAAGVEMLAYRCRLDPEAIVVEKSVPILDRRAVIVTRPQRQF